jgi:hypothetical protein
MCLPVSRLFWVSSLAYPNLLGTKGYVVVVVVVEATPWHAWNQTIPWLEKGHLKTLTSLDKRD